jgi:tetraacyldisaccharide 4'-kinase
LEEKEEITEKIDPALHQSLFFTAIAYGTPYHIYNPSDQWVLTMRDEVLLVCGIANRTLVLQLYAYSLTVILIMDFG